MKPMVKKEIEEKLGKPVLNLEFDVCDGRSYSAERLRTRVETFAEMLRTKKALAA